jgi:hypothetical protein
MVQGVAEDAVVDEANGESSEMEEDAAAAAAAADAAAQSDNDCEADESSEMEEDAAAADADCESSENEEAAVNKKSSFETFFNTIEGLEVARDAFHDAKARIKKLQHEGALTREAHDVILTELMHVFGQMVHTPEQPGIVIAAYYIAELELGEGKTVSPWERVNILQHAADIRLEHEAAAAAAAAAQSDNDCEADESSEMEEDAAAAAAAADAAADAAAQSDNDCEADESSEMEEDAAAADAAAADADCESSENEEADESSD